MGVAALATLAVFPGAARAASWDELAAAHDAATCARCRPPEKAAESVADVVRRLRGQPAASTSARPSAAKVIDVAADVAHVAAVSADDRPRQAMRLADDLALKDARVAATFAARLPAGPAQDAALLVALSVWVRGGRQAALRWAAELDDAATRAAALREVTRRLVAAGAREAATLVAALSGSAGRDDAVAAVAQHWSKIDRPAALDWARELAEGTAKTRVMAVLAD